MTRSFHPLAEDFFKLLRDSDLLSRLEDLYDSGAEEGVQNNHSTTPQGLDEQYLQDRCIVKVPVPGYNKTNIKVRGSSANKRIEVTLLGPSALSAPRKEKKFYVVLRPSERPRYSYEKGKCKVEDGILTITIPKKVTEKTSVDYEIS